MNVILYDKIVSINPISNQAGLATEISKVLDYIMDQGLQYEIVRHRSDELKAHLPTT